MAMTLLGGVLGGCTADVEPVPTDPPRAIVDPERSTHFFDTPFPSNALRDIQGRPVLEGFPQAPSDLTRDVIDGWARRLEKTARGFSNNGAAYFRFEGPLDLPTVLTGAVTDPVLLIDVQTGERIPLTLRFTADPGADPFLAKNLLALAPALGHPPRSGATLVAVVMQSSGAQPAEGWQAPDDVLRALILAGVQGRPAVSTLFTVQDPIKELRTLFEDADERIATRTEAQEVEWKRVVHIDYRQSTTPAGEDTTAATVTFGDGSQETTHLYAHTEEEGTHAHDLLDEWPMAVYQAEIEVLNYSGLADRPYMRAGFQHLLDVDNHTGWIDVVDGEVLRAPEPEQMRVVLSLPKDADGAPITNAPIVMYDHGTGGHAYNSVQRLNIHDDGLAIATRHAEAGWAVLGRDAPLYGQRFDLIDAGYSGGSLGFYNVVNLPAFRDNQRQTAVDGHVLLRFLASELNATLPAGSIDPTRVRRIGHSLGSVTTHLGVAPEAGQYQSLLLSGTGGVFSHYFLDTGLIADLGVEVVAGLFDIFGVTAPDPVVPAAVMGAALGLDVDDWHRVDRLHPVMTLFQWTMDPSDPMSVAADEQLPATVLIGAGDHQVPNFTSHAIATALPQSKVIELQASWDYDPHMVLHREAAGHDVLSGWLAEEP